MNDDGLQESSVSVPLLRLDEKSPSKAGPVGRIDRIVNYIANKFRPQDGSNLQLDKRPGWHSLPVTVYDPTNDLDLSADAIPEAMTAGKLGKTNFIVGFDSVPYVYSPAAQAWAKHYNDTIITNKVSQSLVKMDTGIVKCPDSASVNGSHCYVWQDNATGFPYVMILDDDGAVIRSAFTPYGGTVKIKVASDGERFWTVHNETPAGKLLLVDVYDPASGQAIGGTAFSALDDSEDIWDIVCDGAVADGLFIIRPHVAGGNANIKLANVQWISSAASVVSDNVGAWVVPGDEPVSGIAFLYPAGDGHLYVTRAGINYFDGKTHVTVNKTDVSAADQHLYYTIDELDDPLKRIVNITGYVDPVTHNVYTAATVFPAAPGSTPLAANLAMNIRTLFGFSDGVTDSQGQFVRRSVGVASRAFYIGDIACIVSYYTSVPTEVAEVNGFVTQGSPTYFLLRADNGAVVGRIFPGQAAGNAIWQNWTGSDSDLAPDAFQLPSGRLTADGTGVALLVTGESTVKRVRHNDGPFTDVFTSSVGIRNILFDARGGDCVECQNETLIPGPLPRSFDGVSFGAAGAELAPEIPLITGDGASGPYTSGETRSYVIVWERFNRAGNKMRSPSSISVQWTASTDPSAQLVIPTLRTTTYDDWICSIYRTLYQGGQEGLIHYKITSDVAPLFNDQTVDTITFVDSVDDGAAQLNEILYGGSGAIPSALGGGDGQEVDHECAPAMNGGVVFGDRAFLVGYDNNVWFSLPGSQGNSLAFSFGFKMSIGTQDKPEAIACIDTRLIILCSRSIWYNNQSNYLDATGAGDIPTPLQLPISNGCTGARLAYRDGVIYASSAGGFYLLTRDLDSQYIGGAIEDDVNANLPILDILADDSQRIYCLLNNGQFAVYDIISMSWYYWTLPLSFHDHQIGSRLLVVNGNIGVSCDDGHVRVLTPGAYDDDGAVIFSELGIADISVAGLAGCQMIWQVIFMGVSYSEHTLTVDFTPDGLTDETEVFGPIDPIDFGVTAGEEYRSFVEPERMETSSFRLDISDFLTAPGRGLSIQQLGLSVGIIPGTRRQSPGRTGTPR